MRRFHQKTRNIFWPAVILIAELCFGQNKPWYRPAEIRAGFSLFRQDASQIGGSGGGPGGFAGLRFEPFKKLFLLTDIGFYHATDELMKWEKQYTQIKPAFDIKAGLNLISIDRIEVFVNTGIHFSKSYRYRRFEAEKLIQDKGAHIGYVVEAGVDVQVFQNIAFFAHAGIRNDFYSSLRTDQMFWTGTAGFSFRLPAKAAKETVHKEYYLAKAEEADQKSDLFSEIFREKYIDNEEFTGFFAYLREVEERIPPEHRETAACLEEPVSTLTSAVKVTDELGESAGFYEGFLEDKEASEKFKQGYAQGLRYFIRGEYDEAAKVFAWLIRLFPDCPLISNCYYWVGRACYAKGDYENALRAFRYTVGKELAPKYTEAFYFTGLSLIRIGRLSQARLFFRRYIEHFPDDPHSAVLRQYLNTSG